MINSFLKRIPIPSDAISIVRGSGIAFFLQGVGALLSYLLQLVLARWMGEEAYGNFSYAYNWAQLLAVFGACGFTISILNFLPGYIAAQTWGLVRGVLSIFRHITFGASSLLALGLMALFFVFPQEGIDQMVLLAGLSLTPLIALKDVHTEAIRGSNYVGLAYGPPYVLQPLLVLGITLGILNLSGRLSAGHAVLALALSLLMVIVAQNVILRRVLPKAWLGAAVYATREWLQPTYAFLVIQGALVLTSRADVVVLGFFFGAGEVGVYYAAARTAFLISFILAAVNAVVAPKISPLYNKADRMRLQGLVSGGTRLSGSVALLATALMIAFSQPILQLFGEEFVVAKTSLIILALGHLVNAVTGPVGYLLHLTGHQRVSGAIYSGGAITSIILAFILVPRLGIKGAAMATATTLALQNLIMYGLVRRYLRIDPLGFRVKK